MSECCQCEKWKYDERIERKYGDGTGLCNIDKEPKGCDRKSCMLFKNRVNDDKTE